MLSALPLIVVGLFMRSVTQESISDYIKNQHSLIARRAGSEINLFLDMPDKLLGLLLDTRDISEMNSFTQKLLLNRVITENEPMFDRIFIVDSSGQEFTTSDFGPHPTTYVEEEYFKLALKDEKYFSPVKFNDSQEPYVIISFPIKRFNQIVGVLVAEIDLKSIWDLVDEIKIGETGNAFVVDKKGQLIAHIDKKKVADRVGVIDLGIIKDAIQKSRIPIQEQLKSNPSPDEQSAEPESSREKDKIKSAISRVFKSPEGTSMLGTFAYLGKNTDWVIVIQQPVEEAFAIASTMLYQVFAFVALVIIAAILIAYLLEKRITAPITTLVSGVKRYAEGDLDFRIKIEKYDEIAVLAEEFNSMAGSLLENQRKLRRVERLAAMSKFATLVSHEIRNPLNSMNINMQILKREMENPQGDTEKRQKYFNIITSEINRMENLIKNFLMISRPPRFDFLPNDMHAILDEVVLMHSANAEQQHVNIHKAYHKRKIMANVDRDQMKQVFHNIIINALQAMAGGGTLTIKTRMSRLKNRLDQIVRSLRIDFIDDGSGIPKDKLKDIFEVYYTMKKTGTGLGLAIARQIVEGHFGAIEVESEAGKGACLTINLPIEPVHEILDTDKQLTMEH
jgi:signal transduction histidine kinase